MKKLIERKRRKRKTEQTKIKVKSAEDEFKVALKQEIGQGLTDVKREKDSCYYRRFSRSV